MIGRLSVARGLTVEVTGGLDRALTVTADDNLIDYIVTRIVGDELRITASRNIAPSPDTLIQLRVPVPELVAVSASNGALVTLDTMYAVRFTIDAGDGSRVVADGDVQRLAISARNGSVVLAGELIATDVSVIASVGSSIEVPVRERLAGDASEGATIVVVAGDPLSIEIETSGGATVRPR